MSDKLEIRDGQIFGAWRRTVNSAIMRKGSIHDASHIENDKIKTIEGRKIIFLPKGTLSSQTGENRYGSRSAMGVQCNFC